MTDPTEKPKPQGRANEKTHAEVKYIPLDPGDPNETTFAGIKFRANVAGEVPRNHLVQSLQREEITTADGIRTRSVERKIPALDLLKKNPHFEVDGERARRQAPHARVPDSADEYRGYCIAWIAESTGARAMDTRWDAEKGLRDRCGCDKADIDYLRPFFENRRSECNDADSGSRAA